MATTVPMLAPDGTSGEIPADKVQAAMSAGFKRAVEMTSPDGKAGYIPQERTADALKAGFKPTSAQTEQPGFWENLGHTFGIGKEEAAAREQEFKAHPLKYAAESLGGPAYQLAKGAASGFMRSTSELGQAVDELRSGNPASAAVHAVTAVPIVGPALKKMSDEAPATTPGQSYLSRVTSAATPGNVGTGLGTAAQVAPMALGAVDAAIPGRATIPTPPAADIAKRAYNYVRDTAAGSPDAAALRALNTPAKSKFAQRNLQAVEGARPYLQGAQTLAEAQAKLDQALPQVIQPRVQAVNFLSDRPVKGPDGITTVSDLEAERLQLSAINRGLKTGDPAMLKLAEQKGLTQADALAKEKSINAALDPVLDTTGIDSAAIRKTYAQLSTVRGKLAGRSTISEPEQPTGLGRAANVSITRPLTAVREAARGARDIAAGKGLFSTKATDADIKLAFKDAGPLPDLGTFSPRQPAGLLGKGAIPMGSGPDTSGAVAYNPPPVDATTRAQRLGLLLGRGAIELPGAVEQSIPAYATDTTAARMGRLLPERSGAPIVPEYHPGMTPGERAAAFHQYLRRRQQLQLSRQSQAIPLPPEF